MTHIAHILSSFGMGGQERVAIDLVVGQVKAGYRVSAVSLAPAPDGPLAVDFRAAGAAVDRVARSGAGMSPQVSARLVAWLRRNRVDLVHTHNRMALLYGAPAGRLAGVKVVHTKHGRNPQEGRQLLAAQAAGRLVHAFVAVSPETAATARARKEVPEGRLSVIENGIELGRFHPDPAARAKVRGELAIGADAFVVGTVGRLAPEKNQALFLRAGATLPETHLVVAGDGPLLESLKKLEGELGGNIHLLGARRDVASVLNALDVFVLSSDTEGLPLAIPEAMATGLPVVATSVGGVPTVLDESETGFLIPAGDEAALRERLLRLRVAPELRRQMGERAREVALSRFSAERMQREYIELYERILGGR